MIKKYCGRFAPSPTGPLHFGSLVAAVASYLDARSKAGQWLLRIEDVDLPRNVAGADNAILNTLAAFGFEWDGEPVWQSHRVSHYREILDALNRQGDLYSCACSRREIADTSSALSVDGGLVYPGTCRSGLKAGQAARAWRLRVADVSVGFDDRIQGHLEQNLEHEVGDFVLLRADGMFAYQLAVVVDDAAAGVTDIVRGADLVDSTPRQIWLQQRLGYVVPRYAHLPVATNLKGEKLSKQTLAVAVHESEGVAVLVSAMRFLGQIVPAEITGLTLAEFWRWAIAHWTIDAVPKQRALVSPTVAGDADCQTNELVTGPAQQLGVP